MKPQSTVFFTTNSIQNNLYIIYIGDSVIFKNSFREFQKTHIHYLGTNPVMVAFKLTGIVALFCYAKNGKRIF